LRQVIFNLLRNAVQASPAGSPVEVTGEVAPDHGSYIVSIADRGPGVRDEDKPRIFEPFFSKQVGGSGLGLAVCHGIVAAHGGRITVENRSGPGAVLRVSLPLSDAKESRLAS
jgi:signal transduction histidine kinase